MFCSIVNKTKVVKLNNIDFLFRIMIYSDITPTKYWNYID